jgi:uncharacterized protein (TIGR03435 family)
MNGTILGCTLAALSAAAALAQPAVHPTFEAASVKPFRPVMEGKVRVFTYSPGGVTVRGVGMKEVIASAYGVKNFQVSGPSWLASPAYEIVARTGAPATDEQLKLMLQELLAERFQLTLHRETRDIPVYTLLPRKTSAALHESKPGTTPMFQQAGGGLSFQGYSMSKLADFLSHLPGVDRPVEDMTALNGIYDFVITLTDKAAEPADLKRAMEAALTDSSLLNLDFATRFEAASAKVRA